MSSLKNQKYSHGSVFDALVVEEWHLRKAAGPDEQEQGAGT